jgi:hypothetical protein
VLVDMHSGSARVSVRSEYYSGGVISPFDVSMMDTNLCAADEQHVWADLGSM